MNLAGNKPHLSNGSKASNLANQYVTQCKVCHFGIYEYQQRVWSRRPLGLIHNDCDTP